MPWYLVLPVHVLMASCNCSHSVVVRILTTKGNSTVLRTGSSGVHFEQTFYVLRLLPPGVVGGTLNV